MAASGRQDTKSQRSSGPVDQAPARPMGVRLFPVEPEGSIPPVPIAIGSDDPITFSTSPADEYALTNEMARSAGYSAMTVDGWLDRIREAAFDARFTRAWRPTALEMASDLIGALDRYLLRPKPSGWTISSCRSTRV